MPTWWTSGPLPMRILLTLLLHLVALLFARLMNIPTTLFSPPRSGFTVFSAAPHEKRSVASDMMFDHAVDLFPVYAQTSPYRRFHSKPYLSHTVVLGSGVGETV